MTNVVNHPLGQLVIHTEHKRRSVHEQMKAKEPLKMQGM